MAGGPGEDYPLTPEKLHGHPCMRIPGGRMYCWEFGRPWHVPAALRAFIAVLQEVFGPE